MGRATVRPTDPRAGFLGQAYHAEAIEELKNFSPPIRIPPGEPRPS